MDAERTAYVAVDLGAGSGRVLLANLSREHLRLEEVRRFHYTPRYRDGLLTWPFQDIFDEIQAGLKSAAMLARREGLRVSSVGVDGWGVDYGLIDGAGRLCEDPVCYRDRRTEGVMNKVFGRIDRGEIYDRTGIQFLPINTLFQLTAHAQTGIPQSAARLLLIPDLVHFFLTGKAASEYTNATTTQMINARSANWDREMLDRLRLPAHLLAEIVPAGTDLGPLKPSLAKDLDLSEARIVAPATHDTASAVAGAPLENEFAYISSGTWSLVGVERDAPLIDSTAARHNFTNEGGAFGSFRFLKNVSGMWIFESCRKEWRRQNIDLDYAGVLERIDGVSAQSCLIFPDDGRFLNPTSMLAALAGQLQETHQVIPEDPLAWTKVIWDSLAFRYASVIARIESLTGRKIQGIQIVGGGSQNDYVNQSTATITGLPVVAGPVEASAIGNVLVQAIRAGRFTSLAEARQYVRDQVKLKQFKPRRSPSWEEAARMYAAVEAQYAKFGDE
jgi:rhamnulokinase